MSDTYEPGQPPQIPTKLKAWIGFVISLVGANAAVVLAATADNQISTQEWWGIGLAVVTSIGTGLGVYAAPRYNKSV